MLSKEDIEYLIKIKEEDITRELLIDLFANRKNKKPRFKPNDRFILPINSMGNKDAIETTVGRFIYNKFILEKDLIQFIGYKNVVLDKKTIGKIEKEISNLLLDEKITVEQFIDYLNKIFWFSFVINDFISPSINYDMIRPLPKVIKRKKELVQQYKNELNNGDPIVAGKIEKELVSMAKEELKDNPGSDLYLSNSTKASFENNYKNSSIIRGPIQDNANLGKFDISTDNLMEGISKEDYHLYADLVVTGSYSRAIGTREGGLFRLTLNFFNCWNTFINNY